LNNDELKFDLSSSQTGSYFLLTKSKQKSTAAEKITKKRIISLKPGTRPFSLSSFAGPDFIGIEPKVPQTRQFFNASLIRFSLRDFYLMRIHLHFK